MRALPILAMLLVLAGCAEPGPYYGGAPEHQDRIRGSTGTPIVTSADSYRAGTPVVMRFTNTAGRSVGYNLCRASLERGADDDWRREQSLGEVCTSELRILRPGQSTTYVFKTAPGLRAGRYRIRADLYDPRGGSASLEALSNTFAITRDSD